MELTVVSQPLLTGSMFVISLQELHSTVLLNPDVIAVGQCSLEGTVRPERLSIHFICSFK